MNVEDKEFKKLPFRVDADIDYKKKYPHLLNIPEFKEYSSETLPFDAIFRYLVLYYSANTPLLIITDHMERKIEAARMAGLKWRDKEVGDALICKNEEVNKLILAYLRLQKSFKNAKLHGFIDSFYHQLRRLQSDETDGGEKTKDLLVTISKTEDEIEKTLAEITNGDKDVREVVLQKVEEDRLDSLRPENIALAISRGKNPLGSFSPNVKKDVKDATDKEEDEE